MPGGPGDRAGAVCVEQRDQSHLPAEELRARAHRHQMGGETRYLQQTLDRYLHIRYQIDIYTADTR